MNDTMMIRNPETNEWESVYLPPSGDTYPIGAYAFIAGEQAPTNWLRCDGQAVSRTEYADLFNAIGTTYGSGDGSTTFNLPNVNLSNRTLVGSSGDGEFALGNTMGEKEHTLTIDEMPAHNHSLDGWIHSGAGAYFAGTVNNTGTKYEDSLYTKRTGNGTAHNNMQPSIAAICIIKAKQSIGLVGSVTKDINDQNDNAVVNAKTVKNYVDNTNTYSTDEKVVGTWIDGKPLYRKVVNIGNLPNATTKDVPHGIENLSAVITMKGYALYSNQVLPIPFTHVSAIASQIQIYIYEDNLKIVTAIDRSAATGYVILEYTKTTD